MSKAIVFDFDGVIVDSEPLHHRAFLRVLEPYKIHFDYDQYLAQFVGYDDRDGFRAMLDLWREKFSPYKDDDSMITRLCREKAEVFESIVAEGFEPIPGVLDFIGLVHSQLPLAIASGATRADVDLFLCKLGLSEHFCPVVTADDVVRSKPDPATYRLAVEGLSKRLPDVNLTASDCVAIEDTPAGIESARAAGLKTLAVATTHGPGKLHRADRVATSLEGLNISDLEAWFD